MRWTNRYGVEDAIAKAIMESEMQPTVGTGVISVTQMVGPAQARVITAQRWDDIVEDVSEGLWRLLGQAIHMILERAKLDNVLQEERLEVLRYGWRLLGHPDLYRPPDTLIDYKITSVWSFMFGEKPEWTAQLNTYADLYSAYGFPCRELKIAAILRDHMESLVRTGTNYPPMPFYSLRVPVWDNIVAEQYISHRLAIHEESERRLNIAPCTDEERWKRPDRYAVMKAGRKKALRVLDSEEGAEAWIDGNKPKGKIEIARRRGFSVRCRPRANGNSYCRAAPWCPQWAELCELEAPDGESEAD